MPTTRPQLTITETDDVAQALEEAAKRWPEDRATRSRLLLRLVEEGYRAIRDERRQQHAEQRRAAIKRTAGSLTGVYESDYLAQLREGGPSDSAPQCG